MGTEKVLNKDDVRRKFKPQIRTALDKFIEAFKESEKQKSQNQKIGKIVENNKDLINKVFDKGGKEIDSSKIDQNLIGGLKKRL